MTPESVQLCVKWSVNEDGSALDAGCAKHPSDSR